MPAAITADEDSWRVPQSCITEFKADGSSGLTAATG
jgi:hypothetical protein